MAGEAYNMELAVDMVLDTGRSVVAAVFAVVVGGFVADKVLGTLMGKMVEVVEDIF